MAQCYSSGSAPLNALANQLLGESSFAAKSSLVRHTQHISQQQPQHHSHYQGHFPRQPLAPVPQNHYHQDHVSLQKQRSSQEPKQIDPFEHAWSTSTGAPTASRLYHPQPRPVEPFYYDHGSLEHQRELPDLNLVTAWEQHLQAGNDGPLNQVQSALSGTSIVPPPSLLTSEFESFHYQPSAQDPSGTQDSAWAKEWATHRAQEEDDDDEDEFREEWSNDHFTQAYINTHRSKFQEIEEQERLKEARLEEERERQRQTSGGPPRSAWMMNGSTSAATIAAETVTGGPGRLRVPGLDSMEEHWVQNSSSSVSLSVDEFMNFGYQDPTAMQPLQQPMPKPKPFHTQDQFVSLVSDLRMAEQSYFPGATSALNPESSESEHSSTSLVETHSAWAQEFDAENQQRRQRHIGAEWNWEKLFGKDPHRQMELAVEASKAAVKTGGKDGVDEAERLRAVALTRLQALFGHLTPSSSGSRPSAPA